MASVVGANVALKAAVMVGLENVQNPRIAVAVAVAGFGEVAVLKMLYVADVGKGDAVAMLTHDGRHVIVGIRAQATRAEGQAVAGVIHHFEESVDGGLVHQQTGQAENIPRRIVHVDGHFDVALLAGGHDGLQKVFQVRPQLFVVDAFVRTEQLVQLGHALGLPAREGHMVLFGEVQNVLGHGVVIVLDHILLVEQGGGAVAYGVEQIGTSPVEDGHEVVADHLNSEFGQVADALLVVLDVCISGRQTDLDVVMDVDRFHHIHVEAVLVQLTLDFCNLMLLPDLTGHFVVECPHDSRHAGDLLDVGQLDPVVPFTVPAESHLHWHIRVSFSVSDFIFYSSLWRACH